MTDVLDLRAVAGRMGADVPAPADGASVLHRAEAVRINPLGVLACGGKATDVLLQCCELRAARCGTNALEVLVPVAVDTEVASLERLPEGLRIRIGEEASAPALRGLLASPVYGFIADRVAPHLLAKSGNGTALGSKQVPSAPYALALHEHNRIAEAVADFVRRVQDLPSESQYPGLIGRGVIVVVGTDNGAVGRGLSRHLTRLVRMAVQQCGADLMLLHMALWGSNFEAKVPNARGAAAAELGGAVETLLAAQGHLALPREIDLDQAASDAGADFNVVLSGLPSQGDEGLFKAHAARVLDLIGTSAGMKIAAIWRNR